MEKSAAPAHKTNEDLELPDWSGMDDCSRRLTTEEALRLLEEYVAGGAREHRARKEPKEVVEFKL